jgi:hypothetical protein
MFAPEGYGTWDRTFRDLEHVSTALIKALCVADATEKGLLTGSDVHYPAELLLVKSGICKNRSEAELTESILLCLILSRYLETFPPLVFSLSLGALEVDEVIFEHRDQLYYCDFSWPISESNYFKPFFEYMKLGFDGGELFERFIFFDAPTGRIRLKNGAQHHLINGIGMDEDRAAKTLLSVQSLKDCVLCWKLVPSPEEFREFLMFLERGDDRVPRLLDEICGVKLASQSLEGFKGRGGRPSETHFVAAAFRDKYGSRRYAPSVSEAARDLGYDRKTIRKAIAEHSLLVGFEEKHGD